MPNRKENYRDLGKWRITTREQKKRYYERLAVYAVHGGELCWRCHDIYCHAVYAVHGGEPYTDDEKKRILEHSIPDRELAIEIGRTVRTIQVLRSRWRKKWRNLENGS